MTASRLYIYGFVNASAELLAGLPAVSLPAEQARLQPFGALAAIVSPIELAEVDPTRRHMLAHARVLEAAIATETVLPMRFGMIVAGVSQLTAIVERNRAAIEANLARLSGAIEVGLKASWNREALWKRIAAIEPSLAADCARLNRTEPMRSHFDRLEAGRRVDAQMVKLRAHDCAALESDIRPFAKTLKSLPCADDMMFLHRALLVSREYEPQLFAAVSRYEDRRGAAVDIRYVAPTPAYNFVDLRLTADALRPEAA